MESSALINTLFVKCYGKFHFIFLRSGSGVPARIDLPLAWHRRAMPTLYYRSAASILANGCVFHKCNAPLLLTLSIAFPSGENITFS